MMGIETDPEDCWVVDRIVDDTYAVLEEIRTRRQIKLGKNILPGEPEGGNVIEIKMRYRPKVEQARRRMISELQNDLLSNQGGDS